MFAVGATANVKDVAQDELFTVNPDLGPPPERAEAPRQRAAAAESPLAVRMRPRSLDEVLDSILAVGQATGVPGRARLFLTPQVCTLYQSPNSHRRS